MMTANQRISDLLKSEEVAKKYVKGEKEIFKQHPCFLFPLTSDPNLPELNCCPVKVFRYPIFAKPCTLICVTGRQDLNRKELVHLQIKFSK